ncbi:MAG: LysR family transcriptional regulator [Lachnospiraceae bacterium]|nr:LysR family transcriptional regulator [Lachnospiraceae bacterium]
MTTNQLEYFLAVAKHLNYSAAARDCYTSQPNLSRQIAALENELGYLLFVRDKHQVILTSAGEIFLKHTQDMWDSYQKALTELESLVTSDTFRFGIMIGIQILLDALNYLIESKKFPEIQIIHASGEAFLKNDTVDICYTLLQNGPEPYSMIIKNMKAPILVPKRLFPDAPPSTANEIMSKTFLMPEKELYDVVQHLNKENIQVKYQTFKCVVFDFESYLLDLKFNNYIGYMINDSIGKYADDFWIVDFPEFTINIPLGVKWNPKKDELCKKVALGIVKYINDNS